MTQLLMTTSIDSARQRDRLDVALEELDVGRAGLGRVALGEREHLVGHVEAERAAGRADALRGEQDVDPAAGAEVEDALALVQVGDGDRVAAAEAREDGRVGQLRLLERGVEAGADRLGLAGAAAAGGRLDCRRGVPGADFFVDGLGRSWCLRQQVGGVRRRARAMRSRRDGRQQARTRAAKRARWSRAIWRSRSAGRGDVLRERVQVAPPAGVFETVDVGHLAFVLRCVNILSP